MSGKLLYLDSENENGFEVTVSFLVKLNTY